MKSDIELLELAAKAAGIDHIGYVDGPQCAGLRVGKGYVWNPLEDDGDALRLMTDLYLEVSVRAGGITVVTHRLMLGEQIERHGDNPQSATRRAIVRAAAAMGETL